MAVLGRKEGGVFLSFFIFFSLSFSENRRKYVLLVASEAAVKTVH